MVPIVRVMPGRSRPWRRLIVVVLAGALVACAGVQPKTITARDDCRDCPPGVFSGKDGEITVYER